MPFEREIAKNKLKKRAPMGGARAPYTTTSKKKTPIGEVAKRFGITAREVRDIATALGTAAQSTRNPNVLGTKAKVGASTRPTATKIIAKQVKEAAVAAATGKKGTTSPQLRETGKKINLLAPGEKNNPIFRKQETMPVFKYQGNKKRK
jgi:hypothetical protein